MKRWSFADDESEACDAIMLAPPPTTRTTSCSNTLPERLWDFKVLMNEDLMTHEKLAVVGNCDSLGNWQLNGCVLMTKDEGMYAITTVFFEKRFK